MIPDDIWKRCIALDPAVAALRERLPGARVIYLEGQSDGRPADVAVHRGSRAPSVVLMPAGDKVRIERQDPLGGWSWIGVERHWRCTDWDGVHVVLDHLEDHGVLKAPHHRDTV